MDDLFEDARQFIQEGKISEAIVIYEHVLKRLPEYHEARHDLARLLMEKGDFDSALNVLDDGLELNAGEHSFWFLKGIIQMKMGHYADAMKSFRMVEKIDGLSTALVLNMGVVHRELGSVSSGFELLNKWLVNCNDEPHLFCLLAELHMDVLEWDKALEVLQKAKKLAPEEDNVLYLEGICFSRKGKFLEAIKPLQALKEKMPNNFSLMNELGWAFIQIDHVQAGIDLLNKCYEMRPDSVNLLTDLALAYTQLPDFEKAENLINKAHKHDPYNQKVKDIIEQINDARNNLGM